MSLNHQMIPFTLVLSLAWLILVQPQTEVLTRPHTQNPHITWYTLLVCNIEDIEGSCLWQLTHQRPVEPNPSQFCGGSPGQQIPVNHNWLCSQVHRTATAGLVATSSGPVQLQFFCSSCNWTFKHYLVPPCILQSLWLLQNQRRRLSPQTQCIWTN